jgi:hypothetical protein
MALSYGSLFGSKEFDTANCVVESGAMRLGENAIAAPVNRRKEAAVQGFMLSLQQINWKLKSKRSEKW